MHALRMPQQRPVVVVRMRMGMRATMKWREDVRGNVELVLAVGREKRLLGTLVEHGERRVGRRWEHEVLALRLGSHLFFLVNEGQLFALDPGLVAGGIVLEPEDEVEVFGRVFDIEEVFFEVLEAYWGQMATCEYVVEADVEDGGDAA